MYPSPIVCIANVADQYLGGMGLQYGNEHQKLTLHAKSGRDQGYAMSRDLLS